jgi:uncharacterized protein involved in outer membrane biogenesis
MSILRKVLIGIGAVLGVVVLVIGAGIAALFFVDWNSFRENISGRASDATGRKVVARSKSAAISMSCRHGGHRCARATS